jgi:hypothetical protein
LPLSFGVIFTVMLSVAILLVRVIAAPSHPKEPVTREVASRCRRRL